MRQYALPRITLSFRVFIVVPPRTLQKTYSQTTFEQRQRNATAELRSRCRKRASGKYLSTFCEWVVGTIIENALESRAKKQAKQREIVKV